MRGRGQPHWRLLPLEMLSMCTCYSRLYWRWFGYVSPSYWTTWPSLVLAHFRFLLDHVSGSYCSTCQFSIGTRVMLWLGHMSLLHWTKCRIFIGPCGMTTIPHVTFFYSTTCLNSIRPHVSILLGHMSRPELPMCLFWFDHMVGRICTTYFVCISPCALSWLLHVSFTGSSMCQILI